MRVRCKKSLAKLNWHQWRNTVRVVGTRDFLAISGFPVCLAAFLFRFWPRDRTFTIKIYENKLTYTRSEILILECSFPLNFCTWCEVHLRYTVSFLWCSPVYEKQQRWKLSLSLQQSHFLNLTLSLWLLFRSSLSLSLSLSLRSSGFQRIV